MNNVYKRYHIADSPNTNLARTSSWKDGTISSNIQTYPCPFDTRTSL